MEDQRRAEEQRRVEDMRRAEEQRHTNESYHPSEAAHHHPAASAMPNHLPPMQQGPSPMQNILHDGPPPGPAAPKDYAQDERQRMDHPPPIHPPPIHPPPPATEPERAARKMDVDENYDDSGEDDKKAVISGNNSAPGSASGDVKNTTPTSAGINGMAVPKAEGP